MNRPTLDGARFRRIGNAQSRWMGEDLITEVRLVEVASSETYAGKHREHWIDEETGEEEVWVLARAHKADDPYKH